MRSLFIIMIAMCLACLCANAEEKSKFKIEILPVSKDNACLSWAKAYTSQRIKPLFEDYEEEETKCRMIRFTLAEAYPRTYYYMEITDSKKRVRGRLFDNSSFTNGFKEKVGAQDMFLTENYFMDIGYIPIGENNKVKVESTRLYRKGTFHLESDADLVELVGLLRERHEDKFLETTISKAKFSDVPEEYRKAVVERIRSHIVGHDLKSRKILGALGSPLPTELIVKIMPFAATNCTFYYMYDNTKNRVLRKVTSDADGGFFSERESTAVGEINNVETVFVDQPYVEDGPTERESSEKFYKALEKDGVLIKIKPPAGGKN